MKYKYYPNRPAKLTVEFATKEFDKLIDLLEPAEADKTAKTWLQLFDKWNALSSYIESEAGRIGFAASRNTADKKLELDERYFNEKIIPAITERSHKLIRAFLASRHNKTVAAKYGQRIIEVAKLEVKPQDPINKNLRVKESQLDLEYSRLLSQAKVKINGRLVTLEKATSYFESSDEKQRKEAWLAFRGWLYVNRRNLGGIYELLVKIRSEMGTNLGYNSFVPLGYEQMGRQDYGPNEVAQFRKMIRKHFTPLARKSAAHHANILGKSSLRPWDNYDPRTSLPLGIAPIEQQLVRSQKLFKELDKSVGRLFSDMVKNDLIDIENRPNKRVGGFCVMFSDTDSSAIFCNSTGNDDDVRTITHEMGHAFQWSLSSAIKADWLRYGTQDLSEIPSHGMEFLTLGLLDKHFFSAKNAHKFILGRWQRAIGLVCSCSVGDEFQEWVYKNPKVSRTARENKWSALSSYYLAPSNYSGYKKYQGVGWYWIHHLFGRPFYYIDYALAEVCAMQIAMIDAVDHKEAMKIYMKLCRLGGTKSFLEAVEYVGLRSPFDESLIKDLAAHVAKQLNLN